MTHINLDDLIIITIMIDNLYQPGDLIIITIIIEMIRPWSWTASISQLSIW